MPRRILPYPLALALASGIAAQADTASMSRDQLAATRPSSQALEAAGRTYNPEAPVPPQCYTRIEGRYNPCYVCHQDNADPTRPNFAQDGSLQEAYAFSEEGLLNHWRNLFVDRTEAVARVTDGEIARYVDQDNYAALAPSLRELGWRGWVPDLEGYAGAGAAFDEDGVARDGSGWVAFRYMPQPSTFWPTNGSTDDVLIRLPAEFRTDRAGQRSRDVHLANLALLEIAFQDLDRTSLPPVDETAVDADLDGDGALGTVREVARRAHYVGAASNRPLVRMTYPEGVEFLHSVRYVGVAEDGSIVIPRRMKELRYTTKTRHLSLPRLRSRYGNEQQEKIDGRLPRYVDLGDRGMDTGFGWLVQAFIEDARGVLRPMTDEERLSCRGCHATVGANIDQTWAFPRKLAGAEGYGYPDYRLLRDAPNRGGGDEGEILTYFRRAGGGDEFRSNDEMLSRWFDGEGRVRADLVRSATVYDLITPSPERAHALNKAYREIVREQSFAFGKDATVVPPRNVHERIDEATAPTLPRELRFGHDIRLRTDER